MLVLTALLGGVFVTVPSGVGIGSSDDDAKIAARAPDSEVAALRPPSEPGQSSPRSRPISIGVEPAAKAHADLQMGADPSLAALLQGATYTVAKEGPWTRQRSPERLGVVREITLSRPVSTGMQGWPVIVWNEDTDTYQRYTYNASYQNVSTLTVFLDHEHGLVQLLPGEGTTVVEGPGNEWAHSLSTEDTH